MIDTTPVRGLGELGALITIAQRELMGCDDQARRAEIQSSIRGYQVEVERILAEIDQ